MNNTIKYSSLSLACVFALSGCGGGGGASVVSSGNQGQSNTYVKKDGLSGVVIAQSYVQGAKVCFDTNINGKCDLNEPVTKSYENGKFSFSKLQTSQGANAPLLAEVGQYVMMANQVSLNQVISPFTTVVYNEQLFNPYSSGDNLDAIDDLMDNTTLFKRKNLEGNDYIKDNANSINLSALDIVNTLKSSYVKSSDTLLTIAASVDSMIKQNSLSANISDIPNQKRYDTVYSLEQKRVFPIASQDGNQRTVGISKNSSDAIVHSKWNNRLTLLDKNSLSQKAVRNYLNGANGDTISSGASEKILSKMIVSDNHIYSLVKKDKKENSDIGLGIYKSSFDGSNIPEFTYGSLSVGSDYYSKTDFNDFSLHKTSQKLIASSLSGNIYIFNSKNFSNPQVVNTGSTISDISFSVDGNNYYVAYNKKFHIYSSSTNAKEYSYSSSGDIKQILAVDENRVLIVLDKSSKVILLDISNPNNIVEKTVFNTSANIKKISLSEDKKSFVSLLENSGDISVFSLDKNGVKTTSSLYANANDAIFTGNSKLLAVSDFKAYEYELKGDGTKASLEQKEAWRKNHRK